MKTLTKVIDENKEMAEYSGKRKHAKQMKYAEIQGLFKRLMLVEKDKWVLFPHALSRLEEKRIEATRDDVLSVIFNANIVEYKIDYNQIIREYEERVVLRAKSTVNGRYNMHVVYSLTTKAIVTVWINHIKDRHSTLDESLYTADMKVFGV